MEILLTDRQDVWVASVVQMRALQFQHNFHEKPTRLVDR
jgi:hypothetical protein